MFFLLRFIKPEYLVLAFVAFILFKPLRKLYNSFAGGPGNVDEKINQLEQIEKPDFMDLPKQKIAYQNIANQLDNHMQSMGTNTGVMFDLLEPLTSPELRQIFIEFGVRPNKTFGITTMEGNLLEWFEHELNDIWESDNLAKMKQVWKKTGLWV